MKNFLLYLFSGFIAGVPGGMGMGGGTFLIPILTIFFNVEQKIAQEANLVSFIPMAIIAIIIHAKNGFIKKRGLAFLIVPAILMAVAAGFVSNIISENLLSKIFGGFLIFTAFFAFFAEKIQKSEKV